jgi:D-alanyl-lipoteichoic acid acyltransferase DltB (MBOAT superfamily)
MIAVMSLVFYGFWKPQYTLLLMFAAVMDYFIAAGIDKQQDQKRRRALLIVSLIFNLGLLFYFKYLLFFKGNVEMLVNSLGANVHILPSLKIILPIGISFYTFETISYTVDVYRRHLKPEKNFISYLSFLVFFPHLIAGPILRASDILPQFNQKRKFEWIFIIEGFKRIIFGLFLKVVLADNIAPFVDRMYGTETASLGAIDIWTMAFLFGFQIYFDFCGYSHIAIGCAKLMGINFLENFNFPYLAVSPKAFWKRWHISLSTWIRDYLYLPLTGAKVTYGQHAEAISEIKSNRNLKSFTALFLTWAIMGFWHGASWTFVFFGIYHAVLVTAHRGISKFTGNINKTFLNITGWSVSIMFIMLGWLFFRVEELSTVKDYFIKLISPSEYRKLGLKENIYLVTFLLMGTVIIAYLIDKYITPALQGTITGKFVHMLALSVMIALIIIFLRPISQYIYFQF